MIGQAKPNKTANKMGLTSNIWESELLMKLNNQTKIAIDIDGLKRL